jgi:WD40 repeat protein
VSCGVKQISFWSLIGNTLQKKKGLFGNAKDMQTMFCLGFGEKKEKETYFTGTMAGQIYVWKDNNLEEIIPSAHGGVINCLIPYNGGFMTAGKDGKIRTWDIKFGPLEIIDTKTMVDTKSPEYFSVNGKIKNLEIYFKPLLKKIKLNFYFIQKEMIIKSLHVKGSKLLVGTQACEIFQIDLKTKSKMECVCKGHAEGELWALSQSMNDTNMFATASDDHTVRY